MDSLLVKGPIVVAATSNLRSMSRVTGAMIEKTVET